MPPIAPTTPNLVAVGAEQATAGRCLCQMNHPFELGEVPQWSTEFGAAVCPTQIVTNSAAFAAGRVVHSHNP